MGRRRKYHTQEEKLVAQAEASRRYYGREHERIRETKRDKYHRALEDRKESLVEEMRQAQEDSIETEENNKLEEAEGSSSQNGNGASSLTATQATAPEGPSTATQLFSASIPGHINGFKTKYEALTRQMDPLAYLIKFTEINIADDDAQAFLYERYEFGRLAEEVVAFKMELTTTLGAGVSLIEIIELERKVGWVWVHLNDLCSGDDAERVAMLAKLKDKMAARDS